MAGAVAHTYRYAFPSHVRDDVAQPCMRMSTSGGTAEFPFFFQGALKQPRLTALLLRTVSKIVAARYHLPPAMLERILRECDPVVTSGGGLLRFEGFSACASVYARVDLAPEAYAGVITGQGTTNVDFNPPFRAALAQVRDDERVGLAVGTDEVTLLRGVEQYVERKVDLPVRWLKGFAEVHAYQTQMQLRAELGKIEALRFLRSLPRAPMAKSVFWLVPAPPTLRLSHRETPDSLRLNGIERLRVLEELAVHADRLRVFANPRGTASEWQLEFGPLRFSLTLTAEVWRGFSGEGQVLADLAHDGRDAALEHTRRALHWQAELRAEDFASETNVTLDAIRRALAALGSRGLVGYDLARAAYFHRELPFDLAAVEQLHPRLVAARALVAKNAVTMLSETDRAIEAEVAGSDVVHRVRLAVERNRCTCTWHAKHQGERGPCKHVLAAQLQVEARTPATE